MRKSLFALAASAALVIGSASTAEAARCYGGGYRGYYGGYAPAARYYRYGHYGPRASYYPSYHRGYYGAQRYGYYPRGAYGYGYPRSGVTFSFGF